MTWTARAALLSNSPLTRCMHGIVDPCLIARFVHCATFFNASSRTFHLIRAAFAASKISNHVANLDNRRCIAPENSCWLAFKT